MGIQPHVSPPTYQVEDSHQIRVIAHNKKLSTFLCSRVFTCVLAVVVQAHSVYASRQGVNSTPNYLLVSFVEQYLLPTI